MNGSSHLLHSVTVHFVAGRAGGIHGVIRRTHCPACQGRGVRGDGNGTPQHGVPWRRPHGAARTPSPAVAHTSARTRWSATLWSGGSGWRARTSRAVGPRVRWAGSVGREKTRHGDRTRRPSGRARAQRGATRTVYTVTGSRGVSIAGAGAGAVGCDPSERRWANFRFRLFRLDRTSTGLDTAGEMSPSAGALTASGSTAMRNR